MGHTFRSEFLLLVKCQQKTAFESRRPSRDTVILLHNCTLVIFHLVMRFISDDSQEQTTGLERVLTDAEEKAKMLEIV